MTYNLHINYKLRITTYNIVSVLFIWRYAIWTTSYSSLNIWRMSFKGSILQYYDATSNQHWHKFVLYIWYPAKIRTYIHYLKLTWIFLNSQFFSTLLYSRNKFDGRCVTYISWFIILRKCYYSRISHWFNSKLHSCLIMSFITISIQLIWDLASSVKYW